VVEDLAVDDRGPDVAARQRVGDERGDVAGRPVAGVVDAEHDQVGAGAGLEPDGRVMARHVESGVASFGDTEVEALRRLADALDSHFGRGEPIDDPEAYLEELGIDGEIGREGPPPWEYVLSVVRTTFSSREVISALTAHGVVPVGGKGSPTTLGYENDTGEVRTVTVPQGDPIPIGTLQDIAEQAGANDFHEFWRRLGDASLTAGDGAWRRVGRRRVASFPAF
jgi:predicted RNA binding protein YcfA (HicA-like mRNA interferase family)